MLGLAVGEDEDGITEFWIFLDRFESLLPVFGSFDLIPGATSWILLLNGVDESMIVEDLRGGNELLQL